MSLATPGLVYYTTAATPGSKGSSNNNDNGKTQECIHKPENIVNSRYLKY